MFDINSASKQAREKYHQYRRSILSHSQAAAKSLSLPCSVSNVCVSGITKIEMWIYFSYWLLMTRDNNKNTAYTLLWDADAHTHARNMPFLIPLPLSN